MVGTAGPEWPRFKAINAIFPYAVWKEQDGDCRMINAFLGAAMASNSERFIWRAIRPFVTALFDEVSPDSLNRIIALVSPWVPWDTWNLGEKAVIRWAAAVSAVEYTEEVGQSVIATLLQIACIDSLRPHIPIGIWAWLKKRPSLPPNYSERSPEMTTDALRGVRALGDVEILKSYLCLVWTEWDCPWLRDFSEMSISIREDLGGIGMGCHREDLIKRLDHILERLDHGLAHPELRMRVTLGGGDIQQSRERFGELREVVLDVDREAMEILTRTSSPIGRPSDFTHPRWMCAQNPA